MVDRGATLPFREGQNNTSPRMCPLWSQEGQSPRSIFVPGEMSQDDLLAMALGHIVMPMHLAPSGGLEASI